MRIRFVPLAIVACCIQFASPDSLAQVPSPRARAWSDTGTGRTIQAEFVSSDGTKVVLRIDGREYATPLNRFSKADQDWVRNQIAPVPYAPVAPATPAAPAVHAPSAPMATPAAGAMTLGGQPVEPGGKVEFTAPIPDAVLSKVAKLTRGSDYDKDVVLKDALVSVAFPPKFDPAKSWPLLIVSVTISGKDKGKEPSSIKAMNGFVDGAREQGWIVMAADLPGQIVPGMSANRCALAHAGLDALARQWPASKDWPIATGGFSGGAKYSGWLGGWFAAEGRKVLGMFMGGCNEDAAPSALKEFKPPRKDFLAAKVFLSTGKDDRIAGPSFGQTVQASLKKSGFDEVKLEIFDGPHQLHREHIAPALQWFAESAK